MTKRQFPFISIVMPIRNETAFIERSLGAVLTQDYPPDRIEVLLIDGMSTDDTRSIIERLKSQYPRHAVHTLDNPSKIVPIAMNIGLRQANGEIIIRIDGHTVISPDYIRQCVETLERTHADNVGGKMNAIGSNPFGKAVAMATSTPFGVGGARFHYSDEEEWVDTVYMGAWTRRVFEKIGLFDEELVRNQDDEFNYRLRDQGGRILLSPAIRSKYTVRSTPRALWRQYYQYGFWKVRVFQKHPRQMSLRQFVPPAYVLALLVSALLLLFTFIHLPSSVFHPPSSVALSIVLRLLSSVVPLMYLVANLGASLWTAWRRGWDYSPFLPFIFAILHLTYGLGFLVGLVRFVHRWGDTQGKTPTFSSEHAGTP